MSLSAPKPPLPTLDSPSTPSSAKRKRPGPETSPDGSPRRKATQFETPPLASTMASNETQISPQGDALLLTYSTVNGMRIDNTQLTQVPPGGFPIIHGLTVALLRSGLTPACQQLWDTITADAAFVIPANVDARKRSTWSTPAFYQLLVATIRGFLPAGCPIQLYVPDMGDRVGATTPVPFLLVAPTEQLQVLTDRGMWPTPAVAFTVAPRIFAPPEFIMTLTGYMLDPTEEDEAKVLATIVSALVNSTEISAWLAMVPGRRDNIDNNIPLHSMLTHIARRLRVKSLKVTERGEETVVWRVYISPHFTTVTEYAMQFAKQMKNLNYQRMEGAGRAKRTDYLCGICHGRDHPTGLCEYKSVPGFFDNGSVNDPPPNAAMLAPSTSGMTPNTNASRGHFISTVGSTDDYRRSRNRATRGRRGGRR